MCSIVMVDSAVVMGTRDKISDVCLICGEDIGRVIFHGLATGSYRQQMLHQILMKVYKNVPPYPYHGGTMLQVAVLV